jgi:hypothetical protein
MINYEHMWSLFQISNLWNVYENSKLDESPRFLQQNGFMLNIILSLSRCMLKFHEGSCFEEFECNVWGWTDFGATWHCTIIWMCAYVYIGKNIFVCGSMENIKLAQHEFYMLYCDPHTIVDDPTFDDFNAIKK